MEPIKQRFTIHLEYEMTVDPETGEVLNTELIKKSSESSPKKPTSPPKAGKHKKDESLEPQLVLENNKYYLNTAAVELMGLTSDDKLDIKYEKNGSTMVPVIGTDEAFGTKGGNKLTKSNTVACRGSKNDELSKYGKVFGITPHASKEGLYVLTGDAAPVAAPTGDENIAIEESDEDLPLNIDLVTLIDEKDANIEEIDSSYFQL